MARGFSIPGKWRKLFLVLCVLVIGAVLIFSGSTTEFRGKMLQKSKLITWFGLPSSPLQQQPQQQQQQQQQQLNESLIRDRAIGERFSQRMKHLHEACLRLSNSPLFKPFRQTLGTVISFKPFSNITFNICRIPKVSSQTWADLLIQMDEKLNQMLGKAAGEQSSASSYAGGPLGAEEQADHHGNPPLTTVQRKQDSDLPENPSKVQRKPGLDLPVYSSAVKTKQDSDQREDLKKTVEKKADYDLTGNPSKVQTKQDSDLSAGGTDASEKLLSFISESDVCAHQQKFFRDKHKKYYARGILTKSESRGDNRSASQLFSVEADVSAIFVRDPYGRLLSGYVDKLFGPSDYNKLRLYIPGKFRSDPSELSLRCGHDVTFAELIKYVIHSHRTGEKRDPHFAPIHDECDVCGVQYDLVGHLETAGEDIPYILKAIGSPVNYSRVYEKGNVMDNACGVLSRMSTKLRQCNGMHDGMQRLWRKWQIRGFIGKFQDYPLSPEESEHITPQRLVQVAHAAIDASPPAEERRRQKEEALREAFASIPLEDKNILRDEIFHLDFELFGYDPSPAAVFSNGDSGKSQDDGFRYFKL